MDIDNWDYLKMCRSEGNFWNHMPLNKQKEILEKYYPIGMYVRYYSPKPNEDTRRQLEYADTWGSAEIVEHLLIGSDHTWWILKVKNDQESFEVKGKEYEDMHVGFFIPDIEKNRDNKLKKIGIYDTK